MKGFVHPDSGPNSTWTGPRWLAYGHDETAKGASALCDAVGNVMKFDTVAEAMAALHSGQHQTIGEYLAKKRKG